MEDSTPTFVPGTAGGSKHRYWASQQFNTQGRYPPDFNQRLRSQTEDKIVRRTENIQRAGSIPLDAPEYPAPRLSHDDAKSSTFPAFNAGSMSMGFTSFAYKQEKLPASSIQSREAKLAPRVNMHGSLPSSHPAHHVPGMTSLHQPPYMVVMPTARAYPPTPSLTYPPTPPMPARPELTRSTGYPTTQKSSMPVPAIVIGATESNAPPVSKPPPRKRYACDECGKKFSTRTLVRRHKMIHSDTRPHPCHLCPKRFRQREHLTKHIRIHTGERPFKCPHCKDPCRVDLHVISRPMFQVRKHSFRRVP